MTALHRTLHQTLWRMGFEVTDEWEVGRYSIDCYVPELGLGFEADGKLWHRTKAQQRRDRERDTWILDNAGIHILRVSEAILGDRVACEQLIETFIEEHDDDGSL